MGSGISVHFFKSFVREIVSDPHVHSLGMSPVHHLLILSSFLPLFCVMYTRELDFSSPAPQCTSEVCSHHQPRTSKTKNNGGSFYPLRTTTLQLNVEEGSSAQSFGYSGLPYATGLFRPQENRKKE